MTKYGITSSQEGIDVTKALDAQKVLDSRWQYDEILYEEIVSVPEMTQPKTYVLIEHKLGFLPAFDCYNLNRGEHIAPYSTSGGTGANSRNISAGLVSNTEKIFFFGFFNDPGYSNTKILVRIYNIDMSQEYESPISETFGSKTSTTSQYGIKSVVNRTPQPFRSTDLSEYSINTQSKALGVQRISTVAADASTSNIATLDHKLGYPPTFLAAPISADGQLVGAINQDFVPLLSTANSRSLTLRGAQSVLLGKFSVIIFKEPAEIAI